MTDRRAVLLYLLTFSKTIGELKIMLASLSWDYNGPPIIFNRSHLINVLQRYLNKELSDSDIENWANLVECREDIDFEKNYSTELSQIIYQLANPVLEGKLDAENCKKMIAVIEQY
jgi:hypothetical protein